MPEKPTAAFVLSLLAGILVLLQGVMALIAIGMAVGKVAEIAPTYGFIEPGLLEKALTVVYAVIAAIFIFAILIIVGAVLIYTGDPGKVKTGSIIVLVFSVYKLTVWRWIHNWIRTWTSRWHTRTCMETA